MVILYCGNNKLKDLDTIHNPRLKKLDCGYNEISNLDTSKNLALEELNCANIKLQSWTYPIMFC